MSTQALPFIKNFIDHNLLLQIASTCNLYVIVSTNRMTLFVADISNMRVAGLTVLDISEGSFFLKGLVELRMWLEGLELYGKEYSNTHIIFETPAFAIVPEALFVSDKAEVLLKAQHEIPQFNTVKSNRVEAHHWVNVYAIPDIFCSTLKVLFPQADIHHYAEYLVQANLNSNANKVHTLCINIHAHYIDVMHVYQQELKFINTFPFEAETDVIYFILSVAEQQKIAPDKLELMLTGDVNANGTLVQLLRKYVSAVYLFKRDDRYSYPASFREFQDQQYFTSTSILLCE